MEIESLPFGVSAIERVHYNGKNYAVPIFDTVDPVIIRGDELSNDQVIPSNNQLLADLNKPFDVAKFLIPRRPISVGMVDESDRELFSRWGVQRTLDMPIKMPDSDEIRIPRALGQFKHVIEKMVAFEYAINPEINDYLGYLTVDQSIVMPGVLQREAPCHVDGFQGARWKPKVRGNHTYTATNELSTAYYEQPFDLSSLDEAVHDFFWEMNAQVADTNEAYKWQPDDWEITLMDCYCVHRGVQAQRAVRRTWMRLSFEERARVFDRLGNAHNPLFDYAWEMVPRDIEQLGLRAFREDCDPSLRVFPWQGLDGSALPAGAPKTKPKLSAV